jgi:23S rRNA G2069 N7-methylase RlmK/C1962 C5-methylase RlmI
MSITKSLELAWKKRESRFATTEAIRVFHGPGDAQGVFQAFAVEKFCDHYWIFEWDVGGDSPSALPAPQREDVLLLVEFLKSKNAKSVVYLSRPKGKIPDPSAECLWGTPPEWVDIKENHAYFRIRFQNTRHPGLFLDHEPLRLWLETSGKLKNKRVLNTFSYTGSLSVACAMGGACFVKTLDLSKPTLAWARENWELNHLPAENADFIYGDYFEWLPRLHKKGERFDVVILDPPSFSRGTKGRFSTLKDLVPLHELALSVLNPEGLLITSINSAKLSVSDFRKEIDIASQNQKRKLSVLRTLEAPSDSFPNAKYLKGWIFEAR